MSAYPQITSPPPQLPPLNMPYSSPSSGPGGGSPSPYSPYGHTSSPVYQTMSPPPSGGPGGYPYGTASPGIPSYAAPTSSSSSRLQPYPGQAQYQPQRGYSPVPPHMQQGMPQGMGSPPMGPGGIGMGQVPNRPMTGAGAPVMKGTLRPGQEVKVGDNVVVVEKYLSEGGYAHVYLTHSSRPIGPSRLTTHCLKRIAFDDSQSDMMSDTKREIEVMKQLSEGAGGSRWIVEYLGSEMRRTEGGHGRGKGWEVFILMEFCAGGGIIDLLNKRLRDRLKEREILDIFVDVCEAVAHMHSLPQPLLHRDLKIENILCNPNSPGSQSSAAIQDFRFKLCDFGSTTFPADRPPRTKKEADDLAYDLNRHTTLQYRSPEMVEPLLGLPVGLPADVWALGVLLYKLCYYTTPFEEHGPLAIVNAKYTFPSFPVYSPLMQHLIASMLMEQPIRRPSVFDVLTKVHEMRGTRPSKDYYSMPSVKALQSKASAPSEPVVRQTSQALPVDIHAQMVASIQPGRRGRPTRGTQGFPAQAPPPQPVSGSASAAASPSLGPSTNGMASGRKMGMQLTGEQLPAQGSGPLPKIPTPSATFDMDFGDAFKPGKQSPAPTKPAQPDLLDSMDSTTASDDLAKAFLPSQNPSSTSPSKASPLQSAKTAPGQSVNGFGDSFASMGDFGPKSQAVGKQSSLPTKPAPLGRTVSASSSSAPDAEASFEDRFPSIEALRGGGDFGGDFKPLLARQDSQASDGGKSPLLPPAGIVSRQTFQGVSSFHASLTGESPSSDTHKVAPSRDGHPLPRSNHVTGSAFRMDSASGDERPGFARMGSSSESFSSKTPQQTSAEPPRNEETPTGPPARGAIRLSDSPPPLMRKVSAPAKDLLTDDDALQVKAGYLTMMPQRNDKSGGSLGKGAPPAMASKPKHLSISTAQAQAQDPMASPRVEVESPKSAGVKPPPPTKPAALSSARGNSFLDSDRPPLSASSTDADRSVSGGSTGGLARANTERFRPQSMYGTSMAASSSEPRRLSPVGSNASRSPPSSGRIPPGPVRRSSINEIVSRFERMSSPPGTPEEERPPSSLNRRESYKSISAAAKAGPPPIASKPMGLKPPAAAGGQASTERNGTATPVVKPVARYGRLVSEEGKQAAVDQKQQEAAPPTEGGGARKSIGSLIAQWNQAGPPVAGSDPGLKRKPTIGTGRRL